MYIISVSYLEMLSFHIHFEFRIALCSKWIGWWFLKSWMWESSDWTNVTFWKNDYHYPHSNENIRYLISIMHSLNHMWTNGFIFHSQFSVVLGGNHGFSEVISNKTLWHYFNIVHMGCRYLIIGKIQIGNGTHVL